MKKIFALAFGVSACWASASYELAFVADNAVSGLSSGRILRFDTVSGAYLGSFGDSYSGYTDITVSPSRSRLYGLSSGTLLEMNYSTGVTLRAALTGGTGTIQMSPGESEIWLQNGKTISRYSPVTLGLLGSFNLATSQTVSSMTVVGSEIYALLSTGTTRSIAKFNSSGALLSTSTNTLNLASVGKIGHQVSEGSSLIISFGSPDNANMYYSFSSNGGPLQFLGSYGPLSTTKIVDVTPLHVGGAALSQTSSGQQVLTITTSSGGAFKQIGAGIIGNGVAVTTIVAPEPATMIALGAGLSVFLRKRRA